MQSPGCGWTLKTAVSEFVSGKAGWEFRRLPTYKGRKGGRKVKAQGRFQNTAEVCNLEKENFFRGEGERAEKGEMGEKAEEESGLGNRVGGCAASLQG